MAKEIKELTKQIKPIVDGTLVYNGVEMLSGEIFELPVEDADYLINNKYAVEVTIKKV